MVEQLGDCGRPSSAPLAMPSKIRRQPAALSASPS